ncbi:hypothetical protein VKT23_014097 [Stygiomarasmius scandens]|uniref:Peptidase C14 caspase domain-containing protein n=1 Tax=Marasmiellus scandens TaxID=2682957 RepID=A0ABR1J5Y5_9AGAR
MVFHPPRIPTSNVELEKRALLCGICYSRAKTRQQSCTRAANGTLKGPHHDVLACKEMLMDIYSYPKENIVIMMDDNDTPEDSDLLPTRANMLTQLERFVQRDKPNVQYFFLYAGHSEQIECQDGTEEDGMNECLVPMDATEILDLDRELTNEDVERMVMDDDLKRLLADRLPPTCKLTAVMDTCHSATLLDLFHHRCNRISRPSSSGRRIVRKANELAGQLKSMVHRDSATNQAIFRVHQIMSAYAIPREIEFCDGLHCLRLRWSSTGRQPSMICISACKDGENSWENPNDGSGSLTMALVNILRTESKPILKTLMRKLSSELDGQHDKMVKERQDWYRKHGGHAVLIKRRFVQNPQLSTEIPADMDHFLTI